MIGKLFSYSNTTEHHLKRDNIFTIDIAVCCVTLDIEKEAQVPVPLETVKLAMDRVKALYKEGCDLATKHNCAKPEFNSLIRVVVWNMRLSDVDRADLVHELAKFFGRRGGKAPRKKSAPKSKRPKQPRPKKSITKWLTSRSIELSPSLQLDMLNMRRQAHEDICPID